MVTAGKHLQPIWLLQLFILLYKVANANVGRFQQAIAYEVKPLGETASILIPLSVLEWMTRLKCFLGFEKRHSQDKN